MCRYNFNVMALIVTMPYFRSEIGVSSRFRAFSGTMALGAFVGAVSGGVLADHMGRKGVMTFSSVIFLFGSFFQIGGDNMALILCGRAITGYSVGIYSMLVPLYQSELAPKHLRGRLITIHQFAITVGIFTSSWISYGTTVIPNGSSWRLAIGLQVIPCLVLLFLIYFIPESPRYLMYRNCDSEALRVLAKIHGDGSSDHPEVYMEYVSIQQTINYERTFKNHGSYTRLFSRAPESNLRRLFLGILTQIFQQLTGINPILMFAPQVLHSTGLSITQTSLFANCISATINMGATIPAIFFIDRFGRRASMLVGAIMLCISLVAMSALSITADFIYEGTYYSDNMNNGNSIWVSDQERKEAIAFVVMEYIYVAVFAYTWGSLGWIYPSELYGQGVRAKALSITNGFGWLLNFAVFEFSSPMLIAIHGQSYIVFACCCVVIIVVVYFYFPETKGKSLEEIDLIFGSDIGYFDVNPHHPQTAAATLVHMEKMQKKNASKYPFQLGNSGPMFTSSNENKSSATYDDDNDVLHPTSVVIESSHSSGSSSSTSSHLVSKAQEKQPVRHSMDK
ncbi:general substrate transporter [Absidia repens]|uniref:General substrate transporter n=1 Tax=Absidia repens TaxID=90262 RepID=A0A1X2J1S9_9FUNG|nr:general substrate transporter [Absidia repens]